MPNCGSQGWLCDMPIRFDTYKVCTNGCKYCFVQRNGKYDISKVQKGEGVKALMSWIQGKRTSETNWCDWNIPLHWGGVSDPFQPCEHHYKMSYNALRVFAETKYHFVVSTTGRNIAEPAFLDLPRKCTCVVPISMACSSY